MNLIPKKQNQQLVLICISYIISTNNFIFVCLYCLLITSAQLSTWVFWVFFLILKRLYTMKDLYERDCPFEYPIIVQFIISFNRIHFLSLFELAASTVF